MEQSVNTQKNNFTIKRSTYFKKDSLVELFKSVGWSSYKYPNTLVTAFLYSTHVVSIWDGDKLIGIVRSMDDRCWSANIDCLLIHKDYQHQGLGTIILTELLEDLKKEKIHYINVGPDSKELESFYSRFGFKTINGFYMQKELSNKKDLCL